MADTPPREDLSALRIDRGGSRRRRKRLVPRLVLLAAVLALVWLFQRPLRELYDRLLLPEVEVSALVQTSASSASGARGAAANGYVVARTRAALSSEQPGRIVAMNVVEGARVAKGDVVARLDATEQQAAVDAAQAEVGVAEATLARAAAELESARADQAQAESGVPSAEAALEAAGADVAFAELERLRIEALVTSGDAEARQGDQVVHDLARAQAVQRGAEADLATARAAAETAAKRVTGAERAQAEAAARVESARAQVARAAAALEKTYVRAPFDGVIVLKEAEVGEVVSPNSQGGSTARGSVATMVDFASLEVQAEVPETTLAAVRQDGPARIYLDAYPSEPYAARIDRIWPTADRTKATVEVRVAFDAPDDRLRPDMGVRVVFLDEEPAEPVAEEQPALLVPVAAVVKDGEQRGVFVLERDRVRWQLVSLGETRGTRSVVTAGLTGDELVVVSPDPSLTDGARVRVKP
ncbi:MAG: efflux RND transporter periplasmic adaptor subunit [Planctomycetes bacterium]|nr:efflux RND transporter periplasmic adaptor subunit [Planctomycetota bacterium]